MRILNFLLQLLLIIVATLILAFALYLYDTPSPLYCFGDDNCDTYFWKIEGQRQNVWHVLFKNVNIKYEVMMCSDDDNPAATTSRFEFREIGPNYPGLFKHNGMDRLTIPEIIEHAAENNQGYVELEGGGIRLGGSLDPSLVFTCSENDTLTNALIEHFNSIQRGHFHPNAENFINPNPHGRSASVLSHLANTQGTNADNTNYTSTSSGESSGGQSISAAIFNALNDLHISIRYGTPSGASTPDGAMTPSETSAPNGITTPGTHSGSSTPSGIMTPGTLSGADTPSGMMTPSGDSTSSGTSTPGRTSIVGLFDSSRYYNYSGSCNSFESHGSSSPSESSSSSQSSEGYESNNGHGRSESHNGHRHSESKNGHEPSKPSEPNARAREGTTSIQGRGIRSPLDQFIIRNWLTLTMPLLGATYFTYTNMGFYLNIVMVIIFIFAALSVNYGKTAENNWSVGQESWYTTVYNIVVSQINAIKGQSYFPFIFCVFAFILTSNLVGMVPYSFSPTSHFALTFLISFTVVVGATFIGFILHKLGFFSILVPNSCPLGLLPLLVLIEFISYLARNISLGLRLGANILSGHMLLHILSEFTYGMMDTDATSFVIGFIPVIFIMAFSVLELGIAFIQAQVFTVLSSSYIRDSLNMH